MRVGRISKVEAIDDCCVLAVVGQQMCSRKGVAATVFAALAKANINIRSIAQGSSEYNITLVIDQADSVRALRAVHGRFYLARLSLGIGLIGPGLIGGTLLGQLEQQMQELRDEFDIDVRLLGVATSSRMVLSDGGMDLASWRHELERFATQPVPPTLAQHNVCMCVLRTCAKLEGGLWHKIPPSPILSALAQYTYAAYAALALEAYAGVHVCLRTCVRAQGGRWDFGRNGEVVNLDRFAAHLASNYVPNSVIIDTTASEVPPQHYLEWMKRGIHIITPNKKLNSGPLPQYLALRQFQRESYIHYFYETLGDRILKVEGIFSGTLSYIFNNLGPGRSFSEVVAEAKGLGYTEPDPRDDLAGMDVARKVTILGREAGLNLELENVPVESLVPEPLRAVASVAEFMERLPQFDGDLAARMEAADAAGSCLRFVAQRPADVTAATAAAAAAAAAVATAVVCNVRDWVPQQGLVDCQEGSGSVRLLEYPKSHPFAQLTGSDNIIAFTTTRYSKQPLIIRCHLPSHMTLLWSLVLHGSALDFICVDMGVGAAGEIRTRVCVQVVQFHWGPGAGAEVTAGGVFSDLLRLAAYLGAPS
eukprot:jgi/Botrbrau1/8356/Bobra.0046s0017.1